MISKGDCRFIGSVVKLENGTARVRSVHDDKIVVMNLDGTLKECYYDNIEYVWTP
tara:strand:- start:969 stop:1133 length:165 start_codon:yes stop_codon:yes gene_type:complete